MLQDNFYEQNVERKAPPMDGLIRGILITMTAITFLAFALLVNLLLFLPFAAFAGLTWWYFRNSSLEFDYTMTNKDLDFAVVRGKSSRKGLLSVDVGSQLEVVAPSKSEPVQQWVGKRMKTIDCTSHTGAPYYCLIVRDDHENETKVLFEPDEKLLDMLWRYQPRKVFKTV